MRRPIVTVKSEQPVTVDDLATVRAGDKGDTLILGVVARDDVDFSVLSHAITEESVADHFGLPVSRVKRSPLSQLNAMSIELKGCWAAESQESAISMGMARL